MSLLKSPQTIISSAKCTRKSLNSLSIKRFLDLQLLRKPLVIIIQGITVQGRAFNYFLFKMYLNNLKVIALLPAEETFSQTHTKLVSNAN